MDATAVVLNRLVASPNPALQKSRVMAGSGSGGEAVIKDVDYEAARILTEVEG